MEDIPQPSKTSYTEGDQVKVYLKHEDPDSQYHGIVSEISEILVDDLNRETSREQDGGMYTIHQLSTERELPVTLPHRDLVPLEDTE